MDNYFFLLVDVFFVIGFVTGMGSVAFSLFEIENWLLKRKVIFSSFFPIVFGNFLVTFRVKKRISSCRSRWNKLKMTDLEKSMRTDLGKKDLIVDRQNGGRTPPKSVNSGQIFFQPLILYGKAIVCNFWYMPSLLDFDKSLWNLKTQKSKLGSFFPDLCFIWQSHRFQFLGCALPIGW